MEKLIELCHKITTEIKEFEYNISYTDKQWIILFPLTDSIKWHKMTIVKYQEGTHYFHDMIGYSPKCIEFDGKNIKLLEGLGKETCLYIEEIDNWSNLLNSLLKWLKIVEKDWIKANKKVCEEYPIEYRYGVVPASIVKSSRPDYFFNLCERLGKNESEYFIRLVDSAYFTGTNHLKESISANDFFEYCKLAYIASEKEDENIDKNLTGKEMYLKYADGRCNGLTKIDSDSTQEFSEWLNGKHPEYDYGGHPWEIKRGGNTTHIDFIVSKDSFNKDKIYLDISAGAINRLAEAVQIANTLHKHNIPINIRNADSIRQRILGQDNFGIIPEYLFHSYAERNFNSDQKVFDTIHYKDLGRYKRRIKPFISWEVLPILKQNLGSPIKEN